jgi:multisubunit Na+/H+ antiporter MnhG subunit
LLKHEINSIIKNENNQEFRKFGLTIGVLLVALSIFLFWRDVHSYLYIFFFGLFLTLFGLVKPKFLRPIYVVWMIFALILGHIMTRVILTIIFILLFTPVGLILRFLRKDILNEKYDRQTESYWIKRKQVPFDPKTLEKQY